MDTIYLYTGDTWEFEFEIKDSKGNIIDNLEEYEIKFAIGKDENVVLSKANENAGGSSSEISVSSDKIVTVTVAKEDTRIDDGEYSSELEITSPLGKRYTIKGNDLIIRNDIIK